VAHVPASGGYVEVECPHCGDPRRITERQLRRGRSEGSDFSCRRCRGKSRIVVTEELMQYWVDRRSMEWIIETAMWIWGPPERHP
jgi:predicted RNA-binding Zn-ribbon protein involved in translation (DUF1610 family)